MKYRLDLYLNDIGSLNKSILFDKLEIDEVIQVSACIYVINIINISQNIINKINNVKKI